MRQITADLSPLVRKLEVHAKLSAAERDLILSLPFDVRRLSAHDDLFRPGRTSGHVGVLLDGYALRSKVVRNGARQILNVLMRGDLVGVQRGLFGWADHEIEMLTPGQVAMIAAKDLKALMAAHPAIAHAFWSETLLDCSIQREWTVNIGRRDARERLSHLFCELVVRQEQAGLGADGTSEMPLTQTQIADSTALTPVHVSRVFQTMRRAGLIGSEQRSLVVGTWYELAAIAGFDEGYLRAEQGATTARAARPAQTRASSAGSGMSA